MLQNNSMEQCAYRLVLAGLVLAFTVSHGHAQPRPTSSPQFQPSRGKMIVWNDPAAVPPVYSILGSVGRPGAYEADNKSCTLQRLVRDAKGLSANASSLIRIVRNGRPGERIQFDPNAETELHPGDIAIVDEIHGAHPLDEARPEAVWVALVGIKNSTVVVKLRPEHAVVESVVRMLNQSAETYQAARVIPGHGSLDKSGKLPNGSVILFDPRTIQNDRLPAFPESIKLTALYEVKTIENVAGIQESEARKIIQPDGVDFGVGAFPKNAMSARTRPQPVQTSEPTMVLPEPYVRSRTISRPSELGTPVDLAPAPSFSSQGVPTQSASLPKRDNQLPEPEEATSAARRSRSIVPEMDSTELGDGQTVAEQPVTPLSAFQMLMILSSVAGLVTLAMVARRAFERDRVDAGLASEFQRQSYYPRQMPVASNYPTDSISPAAAAMGMNMPAAKPAAAMPAMTRAGMPAVDQPVMGLPIEMFESLIKNELLLVDEPTPLQESIELQGTPIPPRSYRADATHAVAEDAPHFWKIMKDAAEEKEVAVAGISAEIPGDMAEDPFSASSFERALHRLKGGR